MPLIETETGITTESAEVIRERVKAVFENAFAKQGIINTDPESPVGQLVDAITAIRVDIDNQLLHFTNMFNPQTATGFWQDALAKVYFLDRRLATTTTVSCICRGARGTVIPSGSIVQDTQQNQYKSQYDITIDNSGQAIVDFICTETGPIECEAETVTKIISTIPGWDSVINPENGLTGQNEETQASFEQRRFETVAKNAHGSAYSLECEIKSLDNVTDCVVLDNRTDDTIEEYTEEEEKDPRWKGVDMNPHSVAVVVKNGLDTDIAKAIYQKLDAGCGTNGNITVHHLAEDGIDHEYKIVRPEDVNIYVKVTVKYTQQTPADISDKIKDAIYKDFHGQSINGPIGLGETIYASRFYATAVRDAQVTDLVSLKIGKTSTPTDDVVQLMANEFPTMNSIANIEVIIND